MLRHIDSLSHPFIHSISFQLSLCCSIRFYSWLSLIYFCFHVTWFSIVFQFLFEIPNLPPCSLEYAAASALAQELKCSLICKQLIRTPLSCDWEYVVTSVLVQYILIYKQLTRTPPFSWKYTTASTPAQELKCMSTYKQLIKNLKSESEFKSKTEIETESEFIFILWLLVVKTLFRHCFNFFSFFFCFQCSCPPILQPLCLTGEEREGLYQHEDISEGGGGIYRECKLNIEFYFLQC